MRPKHLRQEGLRRKKGEKNKEEKEDVEGEMKKVTNTKQRKVKEV